MALLVTKKLTKLYAPKTGAQDINIELNKGEIVGFIGPNGAGKSTTMEMIMQLVKQTSGELFFFDTKVRSRIDLVKHLPKIGYLPAEGGVYDFLTAREFLSYCSKFYANPDLDAVVELAEEIHLSLDKPIANLSSGNRKKVSFLASIINKPEILILDEPTSSLDPLVQRELLSEVQKIKEAGGAVLLSSHVLSEVQSICDRVYLIRDSKIIISERTEKLVSQTQKKVTVKNPSKTLHENILKLDGIDDLRGFSDSIEFYTADLKSVTELLVQHSHFDYLIEQPSLEKMFMRYYK